MKKEHSEPNYQGYPAKTLECPQSVYRGIRAYRLMPRIPGARRKDIILRGNFSAPWETKQLTAECRGEHRETFSFRPKARARNHLSKGVCSCGIYAQHNGDRMVGPILAEVVGWGKMVIGDRGWRAEKVRIEQIWIDTDYYAHRRFNSGETYTIVGMYYYIPEEIRDILVERYDVPVHISRGIDF